MLKRTQNNNDDNNVNPFGWLVTFSDLVTLLLTFFVLLLSMSAPNPKNFMVTFGHFKDGGAPIKDAKISKDYKSLLDLINNINTMPNDYKINQAEVKKIIFQLDPANKPSDKILEEAAKNDIDFVKDERGLVLRLNNRVLFADGGSEIDTKFMPLLSQIAELLKRINMLISIEAHTNPYSPLDYGDSPAADDLSMKRSLALLHYFLSHDVEESKFKVGAYGGSNPIVSDPENSYLNGRVEIILYKPNPNSWKG